MDIKAYIKTGILETYALGMTNEEETLEVETLLAQYPELRAELESIEMGLEAFALKQAILPPPSLKEAVLNKINGQEPTKKDAKKTTKLNYLPTVFLVILSLVLAVLAVWLYLQNNTAKNDIDQLKKEIRACEATQTSQKQLAENELTEKNKLITLLIQENTSKIVLVGTENHPDMKAIVYWNKDSKETFISGVGLPKPMPNQDYQLWAIVDGKPLNLGLVANIEPSILSQMKSVSEPQAFAITLEPKGGSVAPTLENMVTMGPV